jgi:Fur family peroxide stress response transcriptional regulator
MILRTMRHRIGHGRRIDRLLRRCRESGLAATPQRLAVYRALLESDDHPTPEALYRKVREAMPSLSLATVYKALDALQGLGVVQEVSRIAQGRRFDANVDHHHHLVCTNCRRITDYNDPALDAVAPPKRVRGFRPESVSVQVLGLCAACSGRRRQRRARRR